MKQIARCLPADFSSTDANKAHQMAWADITYTDTAVILDHSSFISYRTSTSGGLIITFSSADSYLQAKSSWQSTSSLLLVANKAGFCGQAQGESCYFKVDKLDFADSLRSCSASGKYQGIRDVLVSADVEWGAYIPGVVHPSLLLDRGNSDLWRRISVVVHIIVRLTFCHQLFK